MKFKLLIICIIILIMLCFIQIYSATPLRMSYRYSGKGTLCSVCSCTEIYVFCEGLQDPSLLSTYEGPSVSILTITNSSLIDLKKEHLSKFSGVVALTLENDHLNISSSEFSQLHGVLNLNLEANVISRVEPIMFATNKNLDNLLLGRNTINAIVGRAFQSLSKLSMLRLNSNRLKRLEPESFYGLSELKELDLSFNDIETLDVVVFQPLTSLEELQLRSNFVWQGAPEAIVLLIMRPTLRLGLEDTLIDCSCGSTYDAWRRAGNDNLLNGRGLEALNCSSGGSWGDSMELLPCTSSYSLASSTTTTSLPVISKRLTSSTFSDAISRIYDTSETPPSVAVVQDSWSLDTSTANGHENRNAGTTEKLRHTSEEHRNYNIQSNEYFRDTTDSMPNYSNLPRTDVDESTYVSHLWTNRRMETILVFIVCQVAIFATITGATYFVKYKKIQKNNPQLMRLLNNESN